MAASNNTTGILQSSSKGHSKTNSKVIRAKKATVNNGNRTVQKSLESPSQSTLIGSDQNQAIKQAKVAGPGPGGNSKKRFYNSMVVSGLVSESQTPKMISQSSHHAKEKLSLDEPIMQQHMVTNRSRGSNMASVKQ